MSFSKIIGFVECSNCHVWANIPEGFKETKHFAQCPKCYLPMYLIRGTKPEDVALKQSQKVEATLIEHGVKL